MSRARVSAGALALLLVAAVAHPSASPAERLRHAKALFFDARYDEARRAWEAVRAAGGPEAPDALFWVARCSENLGESERALGEYRRYLDARPANATLAEEARTARVGLAAKLFKAGEERHLGVLHAALEDASRTVRYFAALQLSQLGAQAGAPAVPVLRRILAEEKDADLVDRAKLGLLRLDPKALAQAPGAAPPRPQVRSIQWIKVRIYESDRAGQPTVSVNLPVALADLLFKSLPDEARNALKKEGYDADNFWERLKQMGPMEIVTIRGSDGERIQVWTE